MLPQKLTQPHRSGRRRSGTRTQCLLNNTPHRCHDSTWLHLMFSTNSVLGISVAGPAVHKVVVPQPNSLPGLTHLLHWLHRGDVTGNWPIFTDEDTKAKCHRASKTRTKSRTVSSTWFSAPKHAAGTGREREGVTVVLGGGHGEKKSPQVCLLTLPSK